MAKSKRQQQPKRIGQSQPEGVSRAAASKSADAATRTDVNGATTKTNTNGATTSGKSATSGASGATTSASNSASNLKSMRERTQASQRRPQPAKRYAQPPWWRRNLGMLITVSVIVVLIGAFVGFAQLRNKQAAAGVGDPVPASVMKDLTTVPASTFSKVGAGSSQIQFQPTAPNTPLLTANGGKPEVIYVGAEYCPYCAAERWGTVIALSRFGSFNGLTLMRSSSGDSYANTATLSFRNATYTSKYIVFNATETEDRNNQPLATPAADVMNIFTTYNSQGSIPFMSYGNQYVTIGGPFIPTMMANLDWQQISSQVKDPNSDVSQAVIGSANEQTAAICKLTNNRPGDVCNTPVIQQLEAKLPAAK
jgi:hypothetical protein